MTDLELEEIEERVNKTPAGPWWKGLFAAVFNGKRYEFDEDNSGKHMGICLVGHENTNENEGTNVMEIKDVQNTAEFIAHSREDVPNLIAEIRRLKGEG